MPTGFEVPRVLSVDGALQLGLSRAAVRNALGRHGWQRLTPGMLLTTSGRPTRSDWATVGLIVAGAGSALSGWDAVRRIGRSLAGTRPPHDDVLVLTRRGDCRRIGQAWIRVTSRPYTTSRTSIDDPALPDATIVAPPRAIADTALHHRWLGPVRTMVAGAVQHGTCTVDELVSELEGCPRNGSAFLRQALADVADGVRSAAEAEAAEHLRRADVPPFELNTPIVDPSGTVIAVADVLWRELRAVLEIDSREFHFDEKEWKATMRRHNTLTRRGLALTHYPPSAIVAGWTDEVTTWLRARAAELGVPYRVDPRVQPPGEPFYVT